MNLKKKHTSKSDYVGDHGGTYTDIDGMSRQFTYVDHDVKPSKSFSPPMTEEQVKALKLSIEESKKRTIEEILCLPAVNAARNGMHEMFIIRDKENGISWNETVLTGACMLDSNIARSLWNILWKNTVQEQYWWDDLTHEEILAGKWKELI